MSKQYVIPLLLLSINLTAHDANTKSPEKPAEMLQKLEQQIKEQKDDVDCLQAYTTYAPWLIVPGGIGFGLSLRLPPTCHAPEVVGVFCLILCAIGINSIIDRFTTLPEEQRELETREHKKAELLKKLKEMQVQRN